MTSMMFYGNLKLILARENYFGDFLRQSKTDFGKEKISLVMFNSDIKLILEKRKLLWRCLTAI